MSIAESERNKESYIFIKNNISKFGFRHTRASTIKNEVFFFLKEKIDNIFTKKKLQTFLHFKLLLFCLFE